MAQKKSRLRAFLRHLTKNLSAKQKKECEARDFEFGKRKRKAACERKI